MSKAFRCDVCGEFSERKPTVITVTGPGATEDNTAYYGDSEFYDVCNACMVKIRKTGLRRENRYYSVEELASKIG